MRLVADIARERQIGVLFTEHDMDIVFEHADRVMVLDRGELIAQGPPALVRVDPRVRATYLGEGLLYKAADAVLDGGHGPMMLDVSGLKAWYGPAQILFDVALDGRSRRGRSDGRPQRRRQDHDVPGHRGPRGST